MRPALGVIAFVGLVGCLASCARESVTPPATRPRNVVAVAPIAPPSTKCGAPRSEPTSERDLAIDAYVREQYREALGHLTAHLRAAPWDRFADVLRFAIMTQLLDHIPRSSEPQGRVRLAPVPDALRVSNVAVSDGRRVTLQALPVPSATGVLESIFEWAAERGAVLSESMIEIELRRRGRTADERRPDRFGHDDHMLYPLGTWSKLPSLGLSTRGVLQTEYDVTTLVRPGATITYAERAFGTLLVQTACARCAPAERGRIYAFDASDGAFKWTTPPGVGGYADFVRIGGSLVVSSDVAANEPANVHVVDIATGEVRQTIGAKELPSVFARKGDTLLAKAQLGGELAWRITGATLPVVESDRACRLRARAAELDAAADDASSGRAFDELASDAGGDRALHDAVTKRTRIDLGRVRPFVVPAPPWEAKVDAALEAASDSKPPRLVRTSTKKMPDIFERTEGLGGHFTIAPVWYGRLPYGAPPGLPTQYGVYDLRHVVTRNDEPNRVLAVYGERYVHVIEGAAATRIFDLAAFLVPPKIGGNGSFVPQDISGVAVDRGTLFVCNGGGSYASESFGKKGFVTAFDIVTGKLRWRSAPLSCGADVVVWGEHLLTGYGFTDEPDFVNVLRRRDGKLVSRVPLDKAPSALFVEDGKTLVVHTYDSEVRFDIRE